MRAKPDPNVIPERRPQREADLMMLSGCGQMGLSAAYALKHADRARFVDDDKIGKQLTRLHVRKLALHAAPPSWIGELRELRTLQCVPGARLPESLFTLPKLQNLHVDGSKLASLDGVDKLPSLVTVTMTETPLGDDAAAVDALVAKLKGARRTGFGISIKRTPAPAPRGKAKLAKALRDGTLDDGADLRGCDLSGERFEDLLVTYDLRGANLANTTWVRCDFEPTATLSGADLSGATFYDCYLCSRYDGVGLLHRVNATGARWIGCGGDLQLDAQGVKIEVGDRGWSAVYRIDRGVLLLDASTSLDDERESARQLALRVAQWPATRARELGAVNCPSGVLALLLPYRDGRFTPKQLARAHSGKVVADSDEDRLLVPMPDGAGVYRVARTRFGPSRARARTRTLPAATGSRSPLRAPDGLRSGSQSSAVTSRA